MKHFFISLTLAVFSTAVSAQNNSAETMNIKAVIKQQEAAWNKYNWEGFSNQFSSDATLINFVGQFWKGRAEILKNFQQISDCCLTSTSIKFEVQDIRFINPETAIVYIDETLVTIKDYDTPFHPYKKGDTEYKIISDVFVKKDNTWQITAMQVALINQSLTPHSDAKKR